MVLCSTPATNPAETSDVPVARLSVVRSLAGVGVVLCKLFEVEIQPLTINLDERILYEVLMFVDACQAAPITAVRSPAQPMDDVAADISSLLSAPLEPVAARPSAQTTYFEVCSNAHGF